MLGDEALHINTHYYISKQLCAVLNRALVYFNVDARRWYEREKQTTRTTIAAVTTSRSLRSYLQTGACAVCGAVIPVSVRGSGHRTRRRLERQAIGCRPHCAPPVPQTRTDHKWSSHDCDCANDKCRRR